MSVFVQGSEVVAPTEAGADDAPVRAPATKRWWSRENGARRPADIRAEHDAAVHLLFRLSSLALLRVASLLVVDLAALVGRYGTNVSPHDRVILADGLVSCEVVGRSDTALRARVVNGGVLSDHKGVAFPDSSLTVGNITPKDEIDLAFGRELGVDFVATLKAHGHRVVVDVASLHRVLPREAQSEVVVGEKIGAEFKPGDVDIGGRMIEVLRPQIPQRHRLVVVGALVVRRHACAGASTGGRSARAANAGGATAGVGKGQKQQLPLPGLLGRRARAFRRCRPA